MSLSIGALSNYTYSYGSTPRPNLDKNDDGTWSLSELTNYTKAYKSATGTELDADSILSNYDADGDGYLNSSEQELLLKEDALGLSALTQTESSTSASSDITTTLSSLLESMSVSSKYALLNMPQMAEQNSFLLSSISGSYDFSSTMTDLLDQQSYLNLYKIQTLYGDTSGSVDSSDMLLDLYT